LIARNGPIRLTRSTSCHNSSGCSKRGIRPPLMPALAKKRCRARSKHHVVLGGGIGLSRQRNAASLGDRRNRAGNRGRIVVCSQHARTFGGEQLRAGAADAAARTGRSLACRAVEKLCFASEDRLTE